MRILVTLSYYTPYISGLTVYAKNLAEAIANKGYKVTLLTTQHDKRLPTFDEINGVFVQRVPYLFRLSKGFFMPMYLLYVLDNMVKTDTVIINSPQFEGFLVAILAKIFCKKIITVYHCEVRLPRSIVNTVVEYLLNINNFLTLLFSDRIVTSSRDFAMHSKLLPPFSHKTQYIYPPVVKPSVKKNAVKKLTDYIPHKKKFIIGFIGRIAADKGLEYLLLSIPLLQRKLRDDFLILLAGPRHPVGEESYGKKIDTLIRKYRRHVCHIGLLREEEKGAFYSLLDVFVLPSINSTEAFGMVQIEAMFCGVPVIASNLPGVRVPIKKSGMGELAKPKDAKVLSSKIINVLLHRKNYKINQNKIAEYFSFKRTIDQYGEVLNFNKNE